MTIRTLAHAVALILAVSVAPAIGASATPWKGSDLQQRCVTGAAAGTGDCQLYLQGVIEAFQLTAPLMTPTSPMGRICLPPGAEVTDPVGLVSAYVAAQPNQGTVNASLIVFAALQDKYPCSKT